MEEGFVQSNIPQASIKKTKADDLNPSKKTEREKETEKNLFEGMGTPKKLPKIPSVQKSSLKKRSLK